MAACCRTLQSTNTVESALSVARTTMRNAKRWRDGKMVQRWTAAGPTIRKIDSVIRVLAPSGCKVPAPSTCADQRIDVPLGRAKLLVTRHLAVAVTLTDKKEKNTSIEFARPNATDLIGKLFAKVDKGMGRLGSSTGIIRQWLTARSLGCFRALIFLTRSTPKGTEWGPDK